MGNARLSSKQATELQPCRHTPVQKHQGVFLCPAEATSSCSEMPFFASLCSSLFSVGLSLLQRQTQLLPDHAWLSSDDKLGLVVGRCVFWSGQTL